MSIANQFPGSLNIEINFLKGSDTTVHVALDVTGVTGGLPEGFSLTVFPTTGVTTNIDGTFTITKPLNGAGDATYNAVAGAPGYSSVSKPFAVPQRDAVVLAPPELSNLVLTEGSTTTTAAFVFVGALTYYEDGVLQGGIGGSPLVVPRDSPGGVDHAYVIHCVGDDGTAKELPFVSRVQPTASGGVTPGTATLAGYGFVSSAEFDAHCALVEKMRLALITLGKLS